MSLISIVVPLYNEEGNVAELLRRDRSDPGARCRQGRRLRDRRGQRRPQDGTLRALRAERSQQPKLTILNLSRNFGHQIAATAGLDAARGDAVILMDGDLQDPPELIDEFLAKWREGYDVVYAMRRTRKRRESVQAVDGAALLSRHPAPDQRFDPGRYRRFPPDEPARRRSARTNARATPLFARAGELGRIRSDRHRVRPRRALFR